jgi:hypothetical protein
VSPACWFRGNSCELRGSGAGAPVLEPMPAGVLLSVLFGSVPVRILVALVRSRGVLADSVANSPCSGDSGTFRNCVSNSRGFAEFRVESGGEIGSGSGLARFA